MRLRHLAAVSLLALAACGAPKYVSYSSIRGDWKASVPWGWNVITDEEGGHFAATNFLGPFEPDFFLGIPSLSVRWHSYGVPHTLRNRTAEVYRTADEFIQSTLKDVYGPRYLLKQPVREVLTGDNRKAKQFTVESPVAAPAGARWGLSEDAEGKAYNLRAHAYAVVPLQRGFYVLVYPATRDGFNLYEKHFYKLINSFVVLTEGPGGPKPEAAKVFPADKGKS